MAIDELQRVRTKFPQYADLSDADLAGRLASKYPQYQDLVERVKTETKPKPSLGNEALAAATNGADAMSGGTLKAGMDVGMPLPSVAGAVMALLRGGKPIHTPEAQTTGGKVASGAATVAGFLAGPGALARGTGQAFERVATKKLVDAGLRGSMAAGKMGRYIPAATRAVEGGMAGALASAGRPEQATGTAALGAAADVLIPPVIRGVTRGTGAAVRGLSRAKEEVAEAFSRPKGVSSADDLLKLPEDQAANLPSDLRSDYFKAGRQQTTQALAQERLTFQQQAQKAQQLINVRKTGTTQSLREAAARDLDTLSGSFRSLASKQSQAYRTGVDTVMANAESASGSPITFTRDNVEQAIARKYLQPVRAGQPQIPMEDPEAYRAMTEMLGQRKFTNLNEIPARELLQMADDLGQSIGKAAKEKSRAYTPQEVSAQHMRDILLDLLEQKGIDVSGPKSEWAQWVPVRNLGFKLQTPAGPGQVVRILKGQDPVREKSFRQLESLLGERLDRETKQVFGQLDYLKQREIIEQARKAEFDRVMQGKSQFASESAADRAVRVKQLADHRARVRKIVYATAAGIPAVGSASVGAYKVLTGAN